jgi:hypothetical protein
VEEGGEEEQESLASEKEATKENEAPETGPEEEDKTSRNIYF